ncbi:MAG: hypothetical protein Q8Q39_01720 [bacterium]|nr:hypothetical protein [bacterium]
MMKSYRQELAYVTRDAGLELEPTDEFMRMLLKAPDTVVYQLVSILREHPQRALLAYRRFQENPESYRRGEMVLWQDIFAARNDSHAPF